MAGVSWWGHSGGERGARARAYACTARACATREKGAVLSYERSRDADQDVLGPVRRNGTGVRHVDLRRPPQDTRGCPAVRSHCLAVVVSVLGALYTWLFVALSLIEVCALVLHFLNDWRALGLARHEPGCTAAVLSQAGDWDFTVKTNGCATQLPASHDNGLELDVKKWLNRPASVLRQCRAMCQAARPPLAPVGRQRK